MRWIVSRNGDQRNVRKFLWFPVRIGSEVRWLETATIRQQFEVSPGGSVWINREFVG